MPRPFTELEKAHISTKLIEVGQDLINRAGIRKLTIDDLVARVGIAKGSFYTFFPSREDFILRVFESWEDRHRTAIFAHLLNDRGSIIERLETMFASMLQVLDREPGLASLLSTDLEFIMSRLPPERIIEHQRRDREVLEEVFRGLAERGELPETNIKLLPGIMMALFSMALQRNNFDRDVFVQTKDFIARALARELLGGESS